MCTYSCRIFQGFLPSQETSILLSSIKIDMVLYLFKIWWVLSHVESYMPFIWDFWKMVDDCWMIDDSWWMMDNAWLMIDDAKWNKAWYMMEWWMMHDAWRVMLNTWFMKDDALRVMQYAWYMIYDAWYMMHDGWIIVDDGWLVNAFFLSCKLVQPSRTSRYCLGKKRKNRLKEPDCWKAACTWNFWRINESEDYLRSLM